MDLWEWLKSGIPSENDVLYRPAEESDRIDSRKQAILLQIGEICKMHKPAPQGSPVEVADSTPG